MRKGRACILLWGLGELLATTGDLKGAKGSLERGLALSNEIGEKHESAIALSGIGRVLMLEGNLGEARRRFEEALALRKELDEKESIAASLLDLAELSLEEGQPAQAEQSLREISSAGGTPDLVAGFHALLGQALLAQGKTMEARKQAALAMASASKTQRQRTVVQTRIRAAAVQADSGGPSAAKSATRVLREIIHECEQMRFKQLGLQATLALGEIGLRGPDKNSSRRTLESLEKEARAAGFNLIAARAARQCCSTR
jgi:tetratricopeptide (TPR) repeat protein